MSTVLAGGIAAPVLYSVGHVSAGGTLAFTLGCLAGLVITPDLDIQRFTYAQQVVRRSGGRLGRLLAGLWYALWWPYAHLIPYHRHPLSHLPVLGTLLRVLYLALILAGMYWAAGLLVALPPLSILWAVMSPQAGWWLGGLMAMDALHAFLDIL
jgi:uncharacterized metal-binding protein